ncbi:hypothetical protein ABK040_011493 [Willaertia magna]
MNRIINTNSNMTVCNDNLNFNFTEDEFENLLFSITNSMQSQTHAADQIKGDNTNYQTIFNDNDLSLLNMSSIYEESNALDEDACDFFLKEEKETFLACVPSSHVNNESNNDTLRTCTENNNTTKNCGGLPIPLNYSGQTLSNVIPLEGVRRLRCQPYRSKVLIACSNADLHVVQKTVVPSITTTECGNNMFNNCCVPTLNMKENRCLLDQQQLFFFLNISSLLCSMNGNEESNTTTFLHKKLMEWLISDFSEIPLNIKQKDFIHSVIETKCNPQFEVCHQNTPTRLSVFVNNDITIHFPIPSDKRLYTHLFRNYRVELRSLLLRSNKELFNDNLEYTLLEQSDTLLQMKRNGSLLQVFVPIKRQNTVRLKKRKEARQQLINLKQIEIKEEEENTYKGEKKLCFIQIVNNEGQVLGRTETFWVRSKTKDEMCNKKKRGKKRQFSRKNGENVSISREGSCFSFQSNNCDNKRKKENSIDENSNIGNKVEESNERNTNNAQLTEIIIPDKLTVINSLMPGLVFQPSNEVAEFLLKIMSKTTQ